MWHKFKVSKCGWKNGTDTLALYEVATHLQSVKSVVSVKCNKAKCNKTKYYCRYRPIYISFIRKSHMLYDSIDVKCPKEAERPEAV